MTGKRAVKVIKVALLTESRLISHSIEKVLSTDRFELRSYTSDAPDFLDALAQEPPEFLFLNIALKGADGFEICDRIKSHTQLQKINVIFVSTNPKMRERAIQHRAAYFLTIPFPPEELTRVMENMTKRKQTVLYADDSKYLHQLVVPPLVEEGYDVLEAWNGREALEMIKQCPTDILVTDIEMPEMDGFELCRSVKQLNGKNGGDGHDIPVLIVSSLNSEEEVARGFESGADDYITKPVVMAELLSRIKRMLNADHAIRSERILVVDDAESIRGMMMLSLRAQGFIVDEAENGKDALEKMKERSYQIIVTDYEMPEMDGYEFCLALRQNKETQYIPIIMASARESKAELVKVRSTGVQSFISKPFRSDRLVAEVERALAEAKLQQERKKMRHYLSDEALDAIDRFWVAPHEHKSETAVWDKYRTIMFSDIVRFTPLCEKLTAREVVDILNLYFERMVEILIKYNAIIDKFIGDAVLAMYGHEADGAHRAICGAMEMLQALPKVREETGADIHIRIGINSGHVIVGDIGSRLHRRDFTVIGDNVNTAQRLESAAQPDSIYISATTYELVKNIVDADPTEPLKLKGKQAPLQAYRVKSIEPYPFKSKQISV